MADTIEAEVSRRPLTPSRRTESDRRRMREEGERLTSPIPDWVFAFPIYCESDPGDYHKSHGLPGAFSLINLAYLEDEKILSSPTVKLVDFAEGLLNKPGINGLNTSATDEMKDLILYHKLQCYPWAIVELKKPNASNPGIKKAYCQMANACSSVLTILESLVNYKRKGLRQDMMRPIVSFTFIGPEAKVWLAFSKPNKDGKSRWGTCRVSASRSCV